MVSLAEEFENDKTDIPMIIVLRLCTKFINHFKGLDRAISIDGKIFVKGPVPSLLAICKKDREQHDKEIAELEEKLS